MWHDAKRLTTIITWRKFTKCVFSSMHYDNMKKPSTVKCLNKSLTIQPHRFTVEYTASTSFPSFRQETVFGAVRLKYYLVNTSVSHPFLPVTRRASNDHLTRKKLRHCPRQQPVWLARPPLISSFECIFLVFVIIMLLYIDKSQNDVCRWAYIMRMMKWNWRTNTTITNFVCQIFFVK